MKPHESISAALREAGSAGKTGLVPFITAGYPEPAKFIDTLRQVAQVGDVVEVGVPFSDPMADGVTIQRSSYVAIQKGVTLMWIFDQLESVKGELGAPVVLMSYMNPLLAFGLQRLARRSAEAGVCGFIVPDMPFEESFEFREILKREGLGLIQMVSPTTPPDRRETLVRESRGFVYAVTMTGITGRADGLPANLADYLDAISLESSLPVCAGFGICSAKDVAIVGKHADGVIVGSALVDVLEKGENATDFLRGLLT